MRGAECLIIKSRCTSRVQKRTQKEAIRLRLRTAPKLDFAKSQAVHLQRRVLLAETTADE